MLDVSRRFGLSAALPTPFLPDGRVDLARFVGHARWCLAHGCGSVTAFGTTGEGASIGLVEREQMLAALTAGGILGGQIIAGIAASAVADAAAQAHIAIMFGCRSLLVAPPFYFKDVEDDGLHAWFAEFFGTLGGTSADVVLYNIPSVTALTLSVDLVTRLRTDFPLMIRGVKDSSGDWAYAEQLLGAHSDLTILIGDERHLAAAVRLGGQGAISGLANICPGALLPLVMEGVEDSRIPRLVALLLEYPVIPAVKALLARRLGDDAWLAVRSPLIAVDTTTANLLAAGHDALLLPG